MVFMCMLYAFFYTISNMQKYTFFFTYKIFLHIFINKVMKHTRS